MTTANDVRVASLTIEHRHDLPGIGERRPRLSWTIATGSKEWVQAAYEIEVGVGGPGPASTTGRIESADSVLVAWPGPELRSRERQRVRVRVWGGDGSHSGWSVPVAVEAGLLDASDWSAEAISVPMAWHQEPPGPAFLLRTDFEVPAPVVRARLYVTAHGLYEVRLNGEAVGDQLLTPGWTSYGHRLRYYTHDVTALLHPGANAIGAMLADGWFRGRIGFRGGRAQVYGDRLALLAQLELTLDDGSVTILGTDRTWRCRRGPVLSVGLYEGEAYDARREPLGWAEPGFDAREWTVAEPVSIATSRLVAPTGPPVRRVETLPALSIEPRPTGAYIVDFGQNISGHLRLRVRGESGHTVTVRHAEVLEAGELALRPLRAAAQQDTYTLRGAAEPEVWEPRFTVHGFRYAELNDWPYLPGAGDVEAVVCHTDMRRTGWFDCSDPLLNQLHENVVWSMRGNFVDLPTDCPQRDERLGWTGDIQIFAPTAAFLYDCAGLLTSWLADLAAEQVEFGTVPHYVPWLQLVFDLAPAAAWGDAAVLVPWALYQRFGDVGVLRQQYASMKAWVDQVSALVGEKLLWNTGFQFGDWLDPAAPPDRPGAARTDRYLVATGYHAHTTQVLAEIAGVLDEVDDHRRYTAHAAAVRQAFADEFIAASGRLSSDTQTAYALALQFDLLPKPEQRERAGRRLAELVAEAHHRVATGFVGTPLICDALTGAGEIDTAYQLMVQTRSPSWLYPVTMGATTVWERWDSLLPDGRVNPGGMTSFNHYALGAVADWLHRTVAGLAPGAPGYRTLRVAPRPGGGLTYARAQHDTPYGRAAVHWTREGARFDLTVTVPPNTHARVELPSPGALPVEVGSGTHTFTCEVRPADEDPVAVEPDNIHA